ncbi:MAG: DUF4446 family protein [Clostridiaceae bacterium]|nr:DUF4446 family protein [Clostridiaceae bacterium]
MNELNTIITEQQNYIIIALLLLGIINVLLIIINLGMTSRLKKKYNMLVNNQEGVNIEALITQYYDEVTKVMEKNKDIEKQLKIMEGKIGLCIQKIGVIRYNAFENVGSNLSFAIALLDKYDNGFVLNGLYSRESSTTYAKPIINGKSKYTLSAEEIQALDLARRNYNERTFEIKG